MTNRLKCFDCGRFVSLGLGKTAVVTRTDGRKQHYCVSCLQQGAILKDGSVGNKQQWLKEQDWVKEFELW